MAELDAGTANVKFGADTKDFEGGSKNVANQVKQLSEQIAGYADKIKGAFDFSLLGAGISTLIHETYEWAEAMAEVGDQTERLEHMLGATADEVQEFRYIAAQTGQSVDAMAMGLERLGYNAERAQAGSKSEADAFSRLGVSITDAHGKTKDFQTLMEDVADSFSKHADGIEKDALAIQLFGRAGVQMIPALDQGGEHIRELEARSDALSGSIERLTEQQVEMHHTTVDLNTAWTAFSSELFSVFEPAINGILSGITSLLTGFTSWMKDSFDTAGAMRVLAFAADVVAAAVMTLIQLFQDLWDVASAVVNSVGDGLTAIGTELGDIFTGNWSKLQSDAKSFNDLIAGDWSKALNDMENSTATYVTNIKKMFDATLNPPLPVTVAGEGGGKPAFAGPTDMAAAQKALDAAAAKMKATIKDLQSAFQSLFSSMISGFDKAISGLVTGTMDWKQAMFSVIDGIWSSLVKMLEDWVAKWLAGEATMLVASQTADAAKVASEEAANDTSAANMLINAIKSIFTSAKVTQAGVTANLAPTLGPLAIPAGVAAGASVAAIPLDVGSWNIPQDMQATVHAGEAIVPAAGGFADAFRELAGAVSGGGGGGIGGGPMFDFRGATVLDKRALTKMIVDTMNANPRLRPSY